MKVQDDRMHHRNFGLGQAAFRRGLTLEDNPRLESDTQDGWGRGFRTEKAKYFWQESRIRKLEDRVKVLEAQSAHGSRLSLVGLPAKQQACLDNFDRPRVTLQNRRRDDCN